MYHCNRPFTRTFPSFTGHVPGHFLWSMCEGYLWGECLRGCLDLDPPSPGTPDYKGRRKGGNRFPPVCWYTIRYLRRE